MTITLSGESKASNYEQTILDLKKQFEREIKSIIEQQSRLSKIAKEMSTNNHKTLKELKNHTCETEFIKELEMIMFYLEQDNYLDRPSWYACKEVIEELEDDEWQRSIR